ncbi:MAG: hypothetical protein OXC46_03750 [Thaumarchaeota archaeon]|nr:hypothetical protein [Nitrososphaerota archaeon]
MVKILPDTNVVISALIYKHKKILGALSLNQDEDALKFFEHFNNDEIIRTLTVYNESKNKLEKNAQNIKLTENKDLNKKIVAYLTKFVKIELKKFYPRPEKPLDSLVQKAKKDVRDLSDYITMRYNTVYKDDDSQRKEAKRRTKIEIKQQQNKGSWKVIFEKYREQVRIESFQVKKFMSKEPFDKNLTGKKSKDKNSGDKRILAEFVAIKRKHEENNERVDFYIASFDTGFFSAKKIYGITEKSDIVTNEIKERFEIICDIPSEIIQQCRPHV